MLVSVGPVAETSAEHWELSVVCLCECGEVVGVVFMGEVGVGEGESEELSLGTSRPINLPERAGIIADTDKTTAEREKTA